MLRSWQLKRPDFFLLGMRASFWPKDRVAWLRFALTLAAIGMAASFLVWSPYPYLARARAVGTVAPDFQAATPEGRVFRLSNFRGQPVLLNFFSTDCEWSQAAVANINTMLESRPDVVVLSVNAGGEGMSEVKAFAQKTQPKFPVLVDPLEIVTSQYRPFRTPFWFFINAEGVITAVRIGEHHGYNLLYRVNEFLPLPVMSGE